MTVLAQASKLLRMVSVPRGLIALTALALLAGCKAAPDKFAPECPDLKVIRDAADLSRSRGQGTDVTDRIVDARITGVAGACKDGSKGAINTPLTVTFQATRGPAAEGRTVALPYLVTVVRGGEIIDQQAYTINAAFPPNVDSMSVPGDEVFLVFPASQNGSAADYTIYVSFRLTPEELAYNRRKRR